MDKVTRGGIYYDLSISPFYYESNGITYYFSSKKNITKFVSRLDLNRTIISESLSKRFKVNIHLYKLSDCVLYSSIEKRGFLIKTKAGDIVCQNKVSITEENLIHKE